MGYNIVVQKQQAIGQVENENSIVNQLKNLRFLCCIYACHASLKYLAGHRNESNQYRQNHYPSTDAEFVADVRSARAKLEYLVVMIWLSQVSNLHMKEKVNTCIQRYTAMQRHS
jgi:hypothetical protein